MRHLIHIQMNTWSIRLSTPLWSFVNFVSPLWCYRRISNVNTRAVLGADFMACSLSQNVNMQVALNKALKMMNVLINFNCHSCVCVTHFSSTHTLSGDVSRFSSHTSALIDFVSTNTNPRRQTKTQVNTPGGPKVKCWNVVIILPRLLHRSALIWPGCIKQQFDWLLAMEQTSLWASNGCRGICANVRGCILSWHLWETHNSNR